MSQSPNAHVVLYKLAQALPSLSWKTSILAAGFTRQL